MNINISKCIDLLSKPLVVLDIIFTHCMEMLHCQCKYIITDITLT